MTEEAGNNEQLFFFFFVFPACLLLLTSVPLWLEGGGVQVTVSSPESQFRPWKLVNCFLCHRPA